MRPANFYDLMRYALPITLTLAVCEWATAQSVWRNAVLYNYSNVPASAAPADSITNSIFGFWTMDGDGSTWSDASGYSRHLTENGTVTAGTGIINDSAYQASGNASNFLELGDSDDLSGTLTVACWVNFGSIASTRALVTKRTGSAGGDEWVLHYSSVQSKLGWTYYTNAATATAIYDGVSVSTGNWYFLCATLDSTNRVHKLRVGTTNNLGAWTSSGSWGSTTNTTSTLRVLAGGSFGMVGSVDELGIWSRVLSDTEITNLWNAGAGISWPLE